MPFWITGIMKLKFTTTRMASDGKYNFLLPTQKVWWIHKIFFFLFCIAISNYPSSLQKLLQNVQWQIVPGVKTPSNCGRYENKTQYSISLYFVGKLQSTSQMTPRKRKRSRPNWFFCFPLISSLAFKSCSCISVSLPSEMILEPSRNLLATLLSSYTITPGKNPYP